MRNAECGGHSASPARNASHSDAGRRFPSLTLLSPETADSFSSPMKRTPEQVANAIEGFVNGSGNQWDWDGFTSIRIDDPELEKVRQRCIAIRDEFPPDKVTDYCSPAGMEEMRKLAESLKARA
jgi:hypothetical protein